MRKYLTTASLAVMTLAAPALAHAQEGSLVDEIVVTAQKREQSLQDVPIVVTAIGQQVLQDAGVRDVKDLTQVTPGLLVTSTSNETNTVARIRGVGTIGDNAGLESSVGIVVDGIYRPRAGTGIGDLGELQRVEVLKGPQGTLFGKNTSAGVINVITAEPSFDFGAEAVGTLGNYGAKEASVSVTGPIVADVLAGRLYVAGRKRDGYYDVIRSGGPRANDEDNNRNYYTARGQLLYTPTEDFKLRGIFDFTQRNESCCLAAVLVRGGAAPSLDLASRVTASPATADKTSRDVYANRGGPNDVRDKGVSFEANWTTPWFNNATLTAISGWRNWRTIIGQDSDFTAADIIYRDQDGRFFTEFEQWSHELRYAGEAGNLNWMVGGFYAKEDLDQGSPLQYGNDMERYLSLLFSRNASSTFLSTLTGLPVGQVLQPTTGSNDRFQQESTTAAIFTNNSYKITEQLELTVGLRYTQEQKTLAAAYSNTGTTNSCAAAVSRQAFISGIIGGAGYTSLLGAVCAPFNDPGFKAYTSTQKQSAEETTGTIKLSYRFNPDLLTYVSYARGYKAGGFNLDRARVTIGTPNPNTFFDAETVDSYELGAKSTLLGGSLLLNGALFYQEFQNFQLNTYTGISYIVSSIPTVVSRGVDIDFMWRTPIDGLRLQGGLTYAETQYGAFVPGAGVSPRLPNSRLSGAPLYSGSISGSYDRPITDELDLHLSTSIRYSSSYNTGSDLNPLKLQKEFVNVNARVGVGANDDAWRIEVWGANLTDETTSQVVFDTPLQSGTLGNILSAPRTYGMTLRLQY